jgi:hypothetical protein
MKQSLKQCKSQSARLSVIGTCAVLFMLGSAEAGFAQQTASPKPVASALVAAPAAAHAVPRPAVEEEESPKPAKPGRPGGEGIKVHGHWKIDVREKDGTFVKSTEFDNSLVSPNSADVVLSQMLAGLFTPAGFQIMVQTSNTIGTLCGYNQFCTMAASTSTLAGQADTCFDVACIPGMTQTYVPYNSTTNAAAYFQLQGTFAASGSGPITSVATVLVGCASTTTLTVSNAQCQVPTGYAVGANPGTVTGTTLEAPTFTSTTLPSALTVTPGQLVTVTVTISFS